MITKEKAEQFAQEWTTAWNNHDLQEVLKHYTNDFEMTTPLIVSLMNIPSGTLKGKDAVADYWSVGLKKYPDLHFKVLEVLSSIVSITIYYETVASKRAVEFFLFNSKGKVYKSIAHYN